MAPRVSNGHVTGDVTLKVKVMSWICWGRLSRKRL